MLAIETIRLALKHKQDLTPLVNVKDDFRTKQGLSVGSVWTVFAVAKRFGITAALGSTRAGKLALWQVIARVIDQGSLLSAVRLAGANLACDVLNLEKFNEDHLYKNLDWLCENQEKSEDRLFLKRKGKKQDGEEPQLFLYKVAERFGEDVVTFVGDRGMIKSEQIAELQKEDFQYIAAITKPQIKKLLKTGLFQMSLFDQDLVEVETFGGVRTH